MYFFVALGAAMGMAALLKVICKKKEKLSICDNEPFNLNDVLFDDNNKDDDKIE